MNVQFSRVLFILTLLLAVFAVADHYSVLGISRNATDKDIKAAYRKLTREFHPDRNPSPEAAEKYQEINRAYQVLSDADSRRAYDRGGQAGVERHEQQQNGQNSGNPFEFLFGGRPQDVRRGPVMRVNVPVTLRELYEGTSELVDTRRANRCHHCNGGGADSPSDVHTCRVCGGRGHVTETHQLGPGFVQRFERQCSACGGAGKVVAKKCHVCGGVGWHPTWDKVSLSVLPGMSWGEVITVEEAGHELADSESVPGNVLFTLTDAGEPRIFERNGNDLLVKITISLKEALLGFDRQLSHLDGHVINIRRDTVTQPGDVITIENEGMPLPGTLSSEFGHLHVTINVELPTSLPAKAKECINKTF